MFRQELNNHTKLHLQVLFMQIQKNKLKKKRRVISVFGRHFNTGLIKLMFSKYSFIFRKKWQKKRFIVLTDIVYQYADHNKSGFTVVILIDNFIFTVFNIAPYLKQITLLLFSC